MLSDQNEYLLLAYRLGYRILPNGKIKGPKLNYPKGCHDGKGYIDLSLKINGKAKRIAVHRLQAYQKYGAKIFDEAIVVRHRNGNSLDNSYDNILIGNQSSNMFDKPKELRQRLADNAASHLRRFTEEDVTKMKELHREGKILSEIGRIFGIGKGHVSDIINNKIY